MRQSIRRFSPHKTALTVAVLFAVSSLLFIIPMSLMLSMMPATESAPFSIWSGVMLIFLPLFYLVFGYITTFIGALLYNLIARFTGGITFELSGDNGAPSTVA